MPRGKNTRKTAPEPPPTWPGMSDLDLGDPNDAVTAYRRMVSHIKAVKDWQERTGQPAPEGAWSPW